MPQVQRGESRPIGLPTVGAIGTAPRRKVLALSWLSVDSGIAILMIMVVVSLFPVPSLSLPLSPFVVPRSHSSITACAPSVVGMANCQEPSPFNVV